MVSATERQLSNEEDPERLVNSTPGQHLHLKAKRGVGMQPASHLRNIIHYSPFVKALASPFILFKIELVGQNAGEGEDVDG